MNNRQKDTILALLKTDKANRNYVNHYWFPHTDFLDPADYFTAFACEQLDGKKGYTALIENLLAMDGTAKVFVEVYGLEKNGNEQFVYADTLVIFSRLSLEKVRQVFNEPEDIFPDDIGEESVFPQPAFLICENGEVIPCTELSDAGHSIYYCWWD